MTFPILIEVEDSALGSVLKLLHGYPGIAKLHLDLDAVNAPRGARKGVPQGPRRQREEGAPTTSDVVIAFIIKNGPQRQGIIGDELARHGFSKTSSPSVLNVLKEKGILHGIGDAFWDLTDEAKARLAPQQAPALPPPQQQPANTQTAHELILEKMKSLGGTAKRLELAQHLSANNLSASSIGRVIRDLKERDQIVGDADPGTYHLASEKRSAKKPTKAPAKKSQPKPEAEKPERTEKRTAILALMKKRRGPMTVPDIAVALGVNRGPIDGAMHRLQQGGQVEKVSPGVFQLKKNAAEAPSTVTTEE